MSTATAPIDISHVVLTVHDLAAMRSFYQSALGLQPLSSDGTAVRLGAGDRLLVELRPDRTARRASPREAGLFHTAFLMPDRAALARWLIHSADSGVQLQGASDHLVSEAIYLADPEGNGIEIYADRPRSAWHHADGSVKMATEALDLNGLAKVADGPWHGAPGDAVVGHVHLQVGDAGKAATFWRDVIGMPVMANYPGASFHGSGGYHHHIAANVWNSRGAGPRNFPATGLAELALNADDAAYQAVLGRTGNADLADPWGTPVRLVARAADHKP